MMYIILVIIINIFLLYNIFVVIKYDNKKITKETL